MYKFIILLNIHIIFAQIEPILPAQKDAIKSLSNENGFSNEELNEYLMINYNTNLNGLSKPQAISIIKSFQSENPPQNLANSEPELAQNLEIGMSKQFYLIDGNVLRGKILDIQNNRCHIQTAEGLLKIPMTDILEETVDLIKTDEARYKGPLLTEDEESMVVRSNYGDVTINKRDIKTMNRYHGGKLVPWIENKKKFYQGAEQLIGVFSDDNAFVLDPNTFFFSGLSLGYGFTDDFMVTTRFGPNFNGDLNIQPKYRFWYKKTSTKEKALTIGLGIHRAFSTKKMIAEFSHAWYINGDRENRLNDQKDCWNSTLTTNCDDIDYDELDDFIGSDETSPYSEVYLVYSNRSKNPTGRGKIGYSLGVETNTIFMKKTKEYSDGENTITLIRDDWEFKWPFRFYGNFEYDLQKKLKLVGSMWVDNSSRSVYFEDVINDYFGEIGDPLTFDSMEGKYTIIDFDFGFLYAVNENFRLGIHFQQPYIDIYWEFFEF